MDKSPLIHALINYNTNVVSVFYKIWFQCLQEVLGFIADLPYKQMSWYIALQHKITNKTNLTNANIRTCICIIMHITLAKIYKRGANFWEVKMSKLLNPHTLSQYIQENVNWWSFVFGPLSWSLLPIGISEWSGKTLLIEANSWIGGWQALC